MMKQKTAATLKIRGGATSIGTENEPVKVRSSNGNGAARSEQVKARRCLYGKNEMRTLILNDQGGSSNAHFV